MCAGVPDQSPSWRVTVLDPAADAFSRFEDDDIQSVSSCLPCRRQSCDTAADDCEIVNTSIHRYLPCPTPWDLSHGIASCSESRTASAGIGNSICLL